MKTNNALLLWFLMVVMGACNGYACTRVFMNQKDIKIVGRTFDWISHYNESLIVFPRGRLHHGHASQGEAVWYSKYGSIVIQENYQGQKAITDGVNESGLAVHLLSFSDGEYPLPDPEKPGVSILQWLQYYLDNFASVEEVVKHLDRVQIVPADFADFKALPLHVALEDQSGDSAIIEFVKGELRLHHDKAYTTLTNSPDYNTQLTYWHEVEKRQCPKKEMPLSDKSIARFIRSSCYLQALPDPKNADRAVAFIASIIENVSMPYGMSKSEVTWWRTIIDFSRHRYYVKSTRVPILFWLDYGKIDFGEEASYREIKIHDAERQGDVTF